jgi:hypothetical protein
MMPTVSRFLFKYWHWFARKLNLFVPGLRTQPDWNSHDIQTLKARPLFRVMGHCRMMNRQCVCELPRSEIDFREGGLQFRR